MSEKKVRHIEFVQQTQYLRVDEIEAMLKKNVELKKIKKYAYIIHDKDENENKEAVEPHMHCILKLSYVTRLSTIKTWFNCEDNKLQLIKGSWVTACRYLTHMNHPEKYQYPAKDVMCNFNYEEEVNLEKIKGRKRKYPRLPNAIRKKLDKIVNGKICLQDYFMHFTREEFYEFRGEIENAVKLYHLKNNHERRVKEQKKCNHLYMHGKSGIGKTTIAKHIAQQRFGESYFITGSSNDPLDGYQDQKCIILDDLRPKDIEFSNYLKLMDPYNISSYNSRYRNKLDCSEYKIVTSPLSPRTFFEKMKKDVHEDIKQFLRRHETYLEVTKEYLKYYGYDEDKEELLHVTDKPNTVYKEIDLAAKKKRMMDATMELADLVNKITGANTSQSTRAPLSESEYIETCQHIDTPRDLEIETIIENLTK